MNPHSEVFGESVVAYLLAGVLFIRALGGLSRQDSARDGNVFGMAGMALAIAVTAWGWLAADPGPSTFGLVMLGGALGVGAVVGGVLAKRVQMTGMPELVAILHSFVGLAAVLVGAGSYLQASEHNLLHGTEIWVGVAVGAITFTGSIVAWAKLRGTLSGKPLLLPGRHALNALMALAIVLFTVPFHQATDAMGGLVWIVACAVVAGILGAHLVMAIGGADMPVVVSLLNSYSGWAAAASGFVLGNDLLIVTGALVGASGTILSIIMCRAMNRSILSVVFGGFGASEGTTSSAAAVQGTVTAITADELGARLRESHQVIVVPGYGMAVARAQGAVADLLRALQARNVKLRFAIHPVAGRLPGHMNVLLAEAGIPYDMVHEMDEINADFEHTDVVLVIGANDIVNPSALEDKGSPIYGMPVLEVWKAGMTVVLKRGMAAGYAGVDNPLFTLENTRMLFGDARNSVEALVKAVKG